MLDVDFVFGGWIVDILSTIIDSFNPVFDSDRGLGGNGKEWIMGAWTLGLFACQ